MANFTGTSGADTITASSQSDQIYAGDGNDIVSAGNGNDTVYAGAGSDTVNGGEGNDKLYGEAGDDWLSGGEGNDTIDAGIGADTILGGEGNDTIAGGDGDDVIDGGKDNDTIDAGAGNDRIYASLDNDTINGGSGIDVYDASRLTSGVTVNLATGSVRGPGRATISGLENVTGTTSADTITGDANANVLAGNGGNDRIYAGGGNDTILAGNGNGLYVGDSGNDTLVWNVGTTGTQTFDGGIGTDTVRIVLSSGQLTDAVIGELQDFSAAISNPITSLLPYQFSAVGSLLITGTNALSIVVDGQEVPLEQLLNEAPSIDQASASLLTLPHNAAIQGAVIATDGDGDTLSYALLDAPDHGAVTLNAATGQYVYAADGHVGADSFIVRVSDGRGGTADHTVAVEQTNANPEILAQSDAELTVVHNQAVTGKVAATDADGDNYSFSIATGPEHGTLVFTDDTGSYVYTADDYVGYDSFTIRVADGFGGFAVHEVRVNATNTGPTISASGSTGFFSALYDTSVSGQVTASDADGDDITFTLKSGPAHGSVHVDADGRFTFNAEDAAGKDSFVVTASDGHGGTADHVVEFGVIGTLDASAAATAVNVNLGTGAATGIDQAKLPWAINVAGSNFNDVVYGDARANVISGGAGKDELHGAAGHDRVEGGIGDDKLFGEDGNDILDGGDGNDAFNGGAHNDDMRGGNGNDGFFGGGGNDTIRGDAGNDRIYGDGGNDIISGGAGNDIMTGAGFNNGGSRGANTYVWERADVVNTNGTSAGLDHITDFGTGDRLDFTGLVPAHPAQAHDVVRITDTTAGLVVAVDMGGTSGFVDVVILDNVHGLNVDDMAHNGVITI